jgi:hypothetical protein
VIPVASLTRPFGALATTSSCSRRYNRDGVNVHLERDEASDGELVQPGVIHAQDACCAFGCDPYGAKSSRWSRQG